MFGTLKPRACHRGCHRDRAYERCYCGLCETLGEAFGTLTRALLSYDAVFLALVADALMETPAAHDRCRCPLHPLAHRPTVRSDSPAMRYAAAMQILLADQWLADRAVDGRRAARAARPLLLGKVEAARRVLAGLGISLDDLEGFEDRQARCEVPGVTGPREAAAPTADALERVFDRLALLPGVAVEARSESSRAGLAALGRHLGSAIYLIDALDDLEDDHRAGTFNPCLCRGDGLRVSWARVELAWQLLCEDLAALSELERSLPLLRHRELLHSVVTAELRHKAQEAAERAHNYARREEQLTQAARRIRPWPVRVLAAVATALVFVWVWLSSSPASARGPGPAKRLPDAGPPDAGASRGKGGGFVPPSWQPKLPSAPAGSAASSEPEPQKPPIHPVVPGTADRGGQAPTEPGAKKPGSGGPSTPEPARPGSGGCAGKGSPCSGCDGCCKGCQDCGGCCEACDSCKGCGDCCNGCNGCGNCGGCCK